MTFLAALRVDRIDAPCVFDGPINGESFLAYVTQVLVQTLKPGDIVIIDNLGGHRSKAVRAAIRAAGASRRTLEHANPLLRAHPDDVSSAASQVKCHARCIRAAVVDDHDNRFSILWIAHHHPRSERQGAMRGGIARWIERLAASGTTTRGIPGRDYPLARARASRWRVLY
jgi:hypothetical protein